MAIREMEIDDLSQVMEIENATFAVPWTEMGYFSFLMREDTLFLVAEEEGKILGYCGLLMVLDEGDITNVAVEKSRRGQGIGEALVRELAARAARRGIALLHLEVRQSNQAARGLYRKLGFLEDGLRKGYYEEPREDAVLMTLRQETVPSGQERENHV
ncbi:MAG TPA: ribosomal protein S18-alanine N-acetyltransferase [Candidatus Egerieimonas intestinavium]|uniref:Ribosomal protein S18-alanine N-acetyltransferase n=1 Tax=Candidatus Egerieimonas intestinavium TaxID=2840777 RepID=A0A9D1JFU4_9FIRM|nr:ribosomal protein S18-alanine N-acetyltransferase [Candidatus Egerieimonas intestinavium]